MGRAHKYSHVFWDWNGTLFDDVEWCINVINTMLVKRGLSTLSSVSEYHCAFCFPVIEYYRNVGFDFNKEPFDVLAAEYIGLYHSGNSGNCGLFPAAKSVLAEVWRMGITQTILSASEICNLVAQVEPFSIISYFDELLGLTDIYASSKVDVGIDYIRRKGIISAILIGDSKHDFEVAQKLGIDCMLIPNGHQSKETLLTCGVPVLDDISFVLDFL